MVTLSTQQIRRCPIATISPWGSVSAAMRKAVCSEWNSGSERQVPVPDTGRTSSILKAAKSRRATSNMGSEHHQGFLSTNRFNPSSSTQALGVDVPHGIGDTPMATAVVVQARNADSETRVHLTPSTRTGVGCGEVLELEMAASTTRNQSTEGSRQAVRNHGPEGNAATRQGEEYRQMVKMPWTTGSVRGSEYHPSYTIDG